MLRNSLTSGTVYHGLVFESGASVICNQNIITKTGQFGQGAAILYSGGSNGELWQNDINGWNWGVGAIWGSSPAFRNTSNNNKNNRIRNCTYGVRVYQSSFPTICPPIQVPSATFFSGNSIYSNTYNNVHYTSGGTIYGQLTYWGGTPSGSMFYAIDAIDYANWLSSDPWAGSPSINPGPDPRPMTVAESGLQSSMDPSFFEGMELRRQGKRKEAKDFFMSYVSKYPSEQAAYVELYNCYGDDTAEDLIAFFSALPGTAAKEHKLLLAHMYSRQDNSEMARNVNNDLIKEHPNTPVAIRAKLNNAYLALYAEKDVDRAATLFNEAASRADLSTDVELSIVRRAIEAEAAMQGREEPVLRTYTSSEQREPTETDLLQNYPNPYNPATIIQYTVSEPGLVGLKVYDVLGRQIAVLVDEKKQPGDYTVSFDASKLPTGVYFYHLVAGNKSIIKKMSVVK